MLFAAALLVAVVVVCRVVQAVLIGRMQKLAKKTKTQVDDMIVEFLSSLRTAFFAAVALAIASRVLILPSVVQRIIDAVALIVITVQAITLAERILELCITKFVMKTGDGEAAPKFLRFLIRFGLWSVGLLLVLSNLGINVTSLITGMGIGGIAIALAVQNILADLFSSFSLYVDRPFEVGDFIIVGQDMGTVKYVGLKTTRIQALQGEELVIPNSELTNSRVQNFRKMQRRRVVFSFGVTYDTSVKKLGAIPDMVHEIIGKAEHADIDRVHFQKFGESSLVFEVVFYVTSGDYNIFMDTQQEINLALTERFEKEGITFAFPTRTVHMVQ